MCCVTLLRQFNNKDVGVLEGKRRSLYRMHRAAVTAVTSTALAAHDEAQEDKDLDEEFTAIKCEDGNGSSSEEDDGQDDDSNCQKWKVYRQPFCPPTLFVIFTNRSLTHSFGRELATP